MLLSVFVVTIGLNTSTYAQGKSARDRWVDREVREEQREARQNEPNRERQRQEQSERERNRWVDREVREEQREARQNELNRERQRREQSERERDRWVDREVREEQREKQQRDNRLQTLDQQTVRTRYYDGYFDYRPVSEFGHRYNAYNLLANPTISQYYGITTDEQAYAKIFSQGLGHVMSARPMNPNDDDSIAVGKKFILYHYLDAIGWYPSPVEVIDVTKNSFTVKTLPGHPLQGTVKHEIIKDQYGNFWLHQSGTGINGESIKLQNDAYYYAPGMWFNMSYYARQMLWRR
jgi:hypothetical protein